MRLGRAGFFVTSGLLLSTCAFRGGDVEARHPGSLAPAGPCQAHDGTVVQWLPTSLVDRPFLDAWCRAVGAPIVRGPSTTAVIPALSDLAVVTWNAHLDEGRLIDLVADLRAGALTGGRPIRHFALLVQELFRRGPEVPDFSATARGAAAIPTDPGAPDARTLSNSLGLSVVYVPSMRNGAARQEDRGNAILSTEPLFEAIALELPFERQRRVAIGAFLHVRTSRGTEPLRLMNVHLDPVSASSSLWLFRSPRRRQAAAVLAALGSEPLGAGTVLGGDFNTIQSGAAELVYRDMRTWSTSLAAEDPRGTHRMGRLDYLFFRLSPTWAANTTRATRRYGSDHYPVVGEFTSEASPRSGTRPTSGSASLEAASRCPVCGGADSTD